MSKCTGVPHNPLLLEHQNAKDLKEIISNSQEEFIEYIHKLGLDVQHNSHTQNMQNSSTTILTLKTRCFKVEINENFAKIAPLK